LQKITGLKTIFDLGEDKRAGSEHTLLLEIGRDCCCFAFLHKPTNTIDRIRMSTYDELEIETQIRTFFEPLKENAFDSVVVCSAFPQALLFPHKYFQSDYSALDVIYDQPAQDYFHDTIAEWQIVNAYAVPQAVSAAVRHAFTSVQYLHAYTPAIKIYNGYVADNQLMVHFTEQYFQVLLKKDRAIHLAQTYSYKTPLDVIYYLLKICYEFNLSQQEVYLILSGPVARESNLFVDLQQYFTNIHFAQQPGISLPQSPHPHYFFTSLYNLAACVL
jgi:hypothetical protein